MRNATCLHLRNLRDRNAQPSHSVPGAVLGRAMRQMTLTIATVVPGEKFDLGRRRLRDVRERTMSDEFDSLDASKKAGVEGTLNNTKRPSDDVVQAAPVKCRYTKSGICANIAGVCLCRRANFALPSSRTRKSAARRA